MFLGEVKKEEISGIKEIMDGAAELFFPLYLNCEGIGCFGKGSGKILYFDVSGNTNAIKRLQSFLYEVFYGKGLCKKQDGYTPHITFARQAKIDKLPASEHKIGFASGGITLMHSTRVDGRLTYIPIYHSPFTGVFTIDRIEEGIAVCEGRDGSFFNIDGKYLPKGISSGGKIRYNGLEYRLDIDETAAKAGQIRKKFDKEKRKL